MRKYLRQATFLLYERLCSTKHTDFKYEKEMILNNINLLINAEEKICLIGESGSGKSTLLKIILRIYDIKPECLYLDNISIEKVSHKSWYDRFAYVDQNCRLFHMSIYENIKLGNSMASEKEVYEAAKMVGCHDFIERLPDNYHIALINISTTMLRNVVVVR